ncbi:MAG: hypothetical protein J7K85_08800 [Anaerolineaceae bacterium]|nr:hypothetical protein [Anaerolineaceae bacterium]
MKYRSTINKWNAILWHFIYLIQLYLSKWKSRYGVPITCLFAAIIIILSFLVAPIIQKTIEPFFQPTEKFSSLQTFFTTLGGALIGATAIAFSLIMFAMQVNVERMPHGLFRKFSTDGRLLGSFTVSFLLAIFITTMSLIPNTSWVTIALLISCWSTVIILVLFIIAYRRALQLISPTEQLQLILNDVNRNFKAWDRRAKRAVPLLKKIGQDEQNTPTGSSHDLPRIAYFQFNPNWTTVANQGILHAISFARRYAEQGDHEISCAALHTVVEINAAYIKTKEKTFFSNHLMFDNPLSHDGFINKTLEHLRQTVQIGISRGDEQQIEHSTRTLAQLCILYLNINYSSETGQSSTFTDLASGYLSSAVEAAIPHNMPDVLMEGVRLMGNVAQEILLKTADTDITILCNKIALISFVGMTKENFRPVTQTGIEQLAKLTVRLIQSQKNDIRFAAENIHKNIKQITVLFLNVQDTSLASIHSAYLAPYYSGTSPDTLQGWLTNLGNAVSGTNSDNEDAKKIIRHFLQWSNQLHITQREILLIVIEKKSQLAFDVIHWISQITQILLALSNTDACNDHSKDGLRKNALRLISVLSWVPDDKESITFIENYQLTEVLFSTGLDAHHRQCEGVASKTNDLLIDWAFKAGKYQTGGGSFEQSLYALVALSLERDQVSGVQLTTALTKRLLKVDIPNVEIRAQTARNMREQAATLYQLRYSLQSVQLSMERADNKHLQPLLKQIADQISPETAGETVNVHYAF